MKIVSNTKLWLKKRYTCASRLSDNDMRGLKITKKMLRERQLFYSNQVDELVAKIKAYSHSDENITCETELTDYRILSYNGDQMGKVIEKDSGIFRGIYKESAESFMKLWKIGLIQTLADVGLLPKTWISEYKTDEFPFILEHRVVEISNVKMWSPEMIKDACITICLIDAVCRRFGYKLIDGHLNNVTFDRGRPVFTDIGSIVEDKGQYTVFESSLIFAGGYKLIAASLGNSIIDRIQFFDEDNNAVWHTPFNYDEATIECRALLKMFRNRHRLHSSITAQSIIFKLFELNEVKAEYFDLLFSFNNSASTDSCNRDFFLNMLNSSDVESATLVNSSADLARAVRDSLGCKTVFIHHDRKTVNFAYKNLKDISSYCHNYIYGYDKTSLNTIKSNIVIAENVIVNNMSYQNWKLDSVFNALNKITDKYILVSLSVGQHGNRCVDEAQNDIDLFEKKFKSFFDIISIEKSGDVWFFLGRKSEEKLC